jgi:hypothetical protein
LILAIALLLIIYVAMLYFGKDAMIVPTTSSEGFTGDTSVAAAAKGAGNPCQQNSDCVSNFCAVVDSTKKSCF